MSITSAKSGATGISLALDNNFMEPIASVLVGAGGASVVQFLDIPQNYKHLQLRVILRETGAHTDNNAYMNFNNDFSPKYAYHYMIADGSSITAGGNTSSTNALGFRLTGSSSTSGIFGVGVMDILLYSNTDVNKTVKVLSGHDQNGSGNVSFWSGLWQNTIAINAITLSPAVANFAQNSRISLYGIKG